MNEHSESFERFISFDALYDASYKVCRNVRWKDSTIKFEANRVETILRTEADLRTCEYMQLVFSCFQIIERGKARDIRACHINDRLVQNALCEEYLLPTLTPKFIYDNCATLKDKGIDFALNRVKTHLRKAYNQYHNFYALRIDIKKYFDSIDHTSLKRIARQVIQEDDIYNLICYLIDTFDYKLTKDLKPDPTKTYFMVKSGKYIKIKPHIFKKNKKYYEKNPRSLGLGSQTSQLFALLALNEIDHYIKEQLHIKLYGRYMDDLYLLSNSKEELKACQEAIEEKLAEIGLSMNLKKTQIVPITPGDRHNPFKYLKWNFYFTETGKLLQLPYKSKLTRQRRKLRRMAKLYNEGKISAEEVQTSYRGWRQHIAKGNTFYIIQNMDNYFHELFKGVEIK